MSTPVELKPASVFHYFQEVCQVPRSSKREEKIIAYLRQFGESHHLETHVDAVGNVLIRKPATPGFEDRKTVVLQSHMDMVPDKNVGVDHDFTRDPIETIIDGEWMRANGTTLGADNGIGVATELAVLAADDIQHGPVECLFTVDEETGLTGAFSLQSGFMSGDILLNLDSEDEGELFIGCAGGVRTEATFTYTPVAVPAGYFFFRVSLKGLTGGHSGDDINKERANANKVMNRFLCQLAERYDLYVCSLTGGNLHNAIPRVAEAVCAVPMADKEHVRVDLNVFVAQIEDEFSQTEPSIDMSLSSEEPQPEAIDRDTVRRLLLAIHGVHNGVLAMSQDIPGLVETSSNLAAIKMMPDHRIVVTSSQRSSILSARQHMSDTVKAVFELAGASVNVGEGYPGWKPNPNSEILRLAVETYRELFHEEPKVKAIHAGLECGLFLEKYPSLDMVSFGPTLRGVHSPDERMLIPTVDKFWRHLLEILRRIPKKGE